MIVISRFSVKSLANFLKININLNMLPFYPYSLWCHRSHRSRSREKDNVDPVSDKKKIKEEKEDEKVEDVSAMYSVVDNLLNITI